MVVGAGLAGAVAARRFADRGHSVEVFESRGHIGGNCYDEYRNGVMVHQYGPHCFHTNKSEVWEFVNRFSGFRTTAFEVVANTSKGLIPIPFNDISSEIVGDLSLEEIRELLFVDYSEKHWGIPWPDIPSSITGRVPQRGQGRDSRYHLDKWQGVPEAGFTRMFDSMLEGIPVHLNVLEEEWRKQTWDHLVYTACVPTTSPVKGVTYTVKVYCDGQIIASGSATYN